MKDLKPVSEETMNHFYAQQEGIIQESVRRSMSFLDEIEPHGENAKQVITSGYEFTLKMLAAAMETGELQLLDDQAAWAVQRLPHDNVSMPNLIKRLERLVNVISSKLNDGDSKEINLYVDYLIFKIKELSKRKTR